MTSRRFGGYSFFNIGDAFEMLAPIHQTTPLRASEDSISRDRAIALDNQAIYLPTVTSCRQLPVRVKRPLPISVAPRLTEVVPVT